jgi:hypothetical protein
MSELKELRSYVAVILVSTAVVAAGYTLANRRALNGKSNSHTLVARTPSLKQFLGIIESMSEHEQVRDLHYLAGNSTDGKAVVVFFSSASTSCGTGKLLSLIKDSAKQNRGIAYVVLLPGTFSQADLINFKTNLEVPFLVELADAQLTREWLALTDLYGEQNINGTVFLVDQARVLSLAQGFEESKELLKGLT